MISVVRTVYSGFRARVARGRVSGVRRFARITYVNVDQVSELLSETFLPVILRRVSVVAAGWTGPTKEATRQ